MRATCGQSESNAHGAWGDEVCRWVRLWAMGIGGAALLAWRRAAGSLHLWQRHYGGSQTQRRYYDEKRETRGGNVAQCFKHWGIVVVLLLLQGKKVLPGSENPTADPSRRFYFITRSPGAVESFK